VSFSPEELFPPNPVPQYAHQFRRPSCHQLPVFREIKIAGFAGSEFDFPLIRAV